MSAKVGGGAAVRITGCGWNWSVWRAAGTAIRFTLPEQGEVDLSVKLGQVLKVLGVKGTTIRIKIMKAADEPWVFSSISIVSKERAVLMKMAQENPEISTQYNK